MRGFKPRLVVTIQIDPEGRQMDKDRIKGAIRQAAGSIKESLGRASGDTRTEASGKADKNLGKAQSTLGSVKDRLRGALKR